jgi:mevalonate pyrophosphate decarboxylase
MADNDFERAEQLAREGYSLDVPGFYREDSNAVLMKGEWLYLNDEQLTIIHKIVQHSKGDRKSTAFFTTI